MHAEPMQAQTPQSDRIAATSDARTADGSIACVARDGEISSRRTWSRVFHECSELENMDSTWRYMDDTLIMKSDEASEDMMRYLETDMYWKPMVLTKTDDKIFLETEYKASEGRIKYWLKDTNKDGERKVWRYHHYLMV